MVEQFLLHHFNAVIVSAIIASLTAFALALLGYWFYEKQVKFAWLHREQSNAIVEMYRHLKRAHTAFDVLLAPLQTEVAGWEEVETKRVQNAMDAARDLSEFFNENEVYFDDDLLGQLRDLQHEYNKWLALILANRDEQYTRLPTGETVLSLPSGLAEAVNKGGSLYSLLIELRKTIREMLEYRLIPLPRRRSPR